MGPWILILFTNINAFVLDNNFRFFEHSNEFTHVNISDFTHRIYDDSKSNLEADIWGWAIMY